MTTSRLVRRTVAALAATGAAAALSIIPLGGADAAVQGMYAAIGNANAEFTGASPTGGCDLVVPGTDQVQSATKSFTHGTRRASVDLDATFTSHENPADSVRVKGHVDSTLTLRKRHRDLRSFALGVGGKVSVRHSVSGSECRASGTVAGVAQLVFSEHRKGWFTITRDTTKPNSLVQFVLVNVKNGKLVTFSIFAGSRSHETSRALLKPGRYALAQLQAGVTSSQSGIFLKSPDRAATTALSIHVKGEFTPKR